MKLQLATLLVGIFTLGGCASSGPNLENRLDGEWRLTGGIHDGDPLPMPADAPITLTIAEGEASGRAACNHYGGEVTVDDDRLSFDAMSMTEMGCDPAIMDAERAYLAALTAVAGWERTDELLTLSGETVELTYALVPPVADVGLGDTVWVLDGLIDGDAVSSTLGDEQAVLQLRGDGTLRATTGCREFTGRYARDGSTVTVTELITQDVACPELAAQDEHVRAVLVDTFAYHVDGTRLTLMAGDIGLTYVAEVE